VYYNKEFVYQVGKKKDYHYIRMHGQQNIKICYGTLNTWVYTVLLNKLSLLCNVSWLNQRAKQENVNENCQLHST